MPKFKKDPNAMNMHSPYKMKGSPMKRNFGISPAKATGKDFSEKYYSPEEGATMTDEGWEGRHEFGKAWQRFIRPRNPRNKPTYKKYGKLTSTKDASGKVTYSAQSYDTSTGKKQGPPPPPSHSKQNPTDKPDTQEA